MNEQTARLAIDACHSNARDLLRAARLLHEQEKLHHIAFHLVVLALEEIGKGGLLLASYHVGQYKETPSWLERHTEDHVKKLFWAFFGPGSDRDLITSEYMRERENAAAVTHAMRMAAMYVAVEGDQVAVPSDQIEEAAVKGILDFTDATLQMLQDYTLSGGSDADRAVFHWFLEAMDDPAKANAIFGKASLEKRAELGDAWQWMRWIKSQYDEADRIGREMMEQETARTKPEGSTARKKKWSITVRLHTTSHSIRPKELPALNSRLDFMKFVVVNNHKDQLLVEFLLPAHILVDQVWDVAFAIVRRFLAGLNIATMGYFWWYLPQRPSKFYEKLTDLETKGELEVGKRGIALEPAERREVLTEKVLRNAVAFAVALPVADEARGKIFHDYLGGLTLVSKQDVHFQAEPVAYQHFFRALVSAIEHYGTEEDTKDVAAAFERAFTTLVPDEQQRREVWRLGQLALEGKLEAGMVRLEQVLFLKAMCDAYLYEALQKEVRERVLREREIRKADHGSETGAEIGVKEPEV